MKFLTIHLRKLVLSPFPKLYVAASEEDQTTLLRGLPCAMFFDKSNGPTDTWWDKVAAQNVETSTTRAMTRRACADTTDVTGKTIGMLVKEELGVLFHDAYITVPVFQIDRKWDNTGIPVSLKMKNFKEGSVLPKFLGEPAALKRAGGLQDGPPLKVPDGTLLNTVCAACPQNIAHMAGMCEFGDDKCMTHLVIPGKSRLLVNLAKYAVELGKLPEPKLVEKDTGVELTSSTEKVEE